MDERWHCAGEVNPPSGREYVDAKPKPVYLVIECASDSDWANCPEMTTGESVYDGSGEHEGWVVARIDGGEL